MLLMDETSVAQPSFEELYDFLVADTNKSMDYFPWRSTLEGRNSPSSSSDEYGMVANYLTVSADVNFASGQEVELRVLDPVKLEPLSGVQEKTAFNESSEGSCYPALSIACDILDVDPGEFGLNNTEIDSLLSDRNAYRSDTDSGITSDCDSSLDEIELILQEMKHTRELESHSGDRCHGDAYRCNGKDTGLTPIHKVLDGFTLWRVDDSHMPIKKRRRSLENCSYRHNTHDAISRDINYASDIRTDDANKFVLAASQLPRHCLFSSSSESSDSSTGLQTINDPPRKKPGRKPGQCSKGYHLWEFMRDLLLNSDTCPRDVMWVDEDNGIFRICNSDRVAKLWGARKNNKKLMTYEKLSRALRFSRTAGYFGDLPKNAGYPRKLCFKFGPKTPLGRNNLRHDINLEHFAS